MLVLFRLVAINFKSRITPQFESYKNKTHQTHITAGNTCRTDLKLYFFLFNAKSISQKYLSIDERHQHYFSYQQFDLLRSKCKDLASRQSNSPEKR